MSTALVIGGTGPTGPLVVNGLLDRGFDVTIFHRGEHEVDFAGPVRHIHGDPHFPETISEALGRSSFDTVVAQYGRLRHIARHFRGRTGHLVGIGGASRLFAHTRHEAWGPLGRPMVLHEEQHVLESDEKTNKFGYRMAEAFTELMAGDGPNGYRATYIGYPNLYGPRQLASRDWSIVRRLLDGRERIILPDGGLKVESRGYTENVALAPLLAIGHPEVSGGRSYVVTDLEVHTMRQRVEFFARHLRVDVEIIDMPFDLARPAYPLYRYQRRHNISLGQQVRDELGYEDRFTAAEGLAATADWLIENRAVVADEGERLLGDPFDYEREDRMIEAWEGMLRNLPPPEYPLPREGLHPYPHPKKPTSNESETGAATSAETRA